MSTIQPSADNSKARLRGDMYLRAEQRHREEMAAAQLAAIMTAPATPQPAAADKAAAVDRAAEKVTVSSPVVAAPPPINVAPAIAFESSRALSPARVANEPSRTGALPTSRTTPSPVVTARPAPLDARRQRTLMPAAALGATATIATLAIVLTLSPREVSRGSTRNTALTKPAAATAPTAAIPSTAPVAVGTTTAPVRVDAPAPPATAQVPRTPSVAAATGSAARALDGQIRVTSTPAGARVTVDGIGWGQTPLTVGHLPFGTKTIRLTHDGYTAQQAIVRVTADAPRQSVNVGLRRR
jgi:hypothetical protein